MFDREGGLSHSSGGGGPARVALRRRLGWVTSLVPVLGMSVGTLVVIGSLAASGSAGAILYVSAARTDSGNCQASSIPCATVSYAVTQASSGDTIDVSGIVDDNVTIAQNFGTLTIGDWPGLSAPVLDGAPKPGPIEYWSPVITANSGDTVNLFGVTLQHGGQAGIFNNGGTVNVTDGIMFDNSAAGGVGGGISNFSGTVNVTDSTIAANSAAEFGGGGIYNLTGATVNVNDSTISANTASDDNGGGIFNSGNLDITDGTITGNTLGPYGAGSGGGIYNEGAATITGSTIAANTANAFGGGIYNDNAGTATITDSTIADNIASGFPDYSGSGIYNQGVMAVGASIVAANHAVALYPSDPDCFSEGGSWTDEGYNLTSDISVTGSSCAFTQVTDLADTQPDLGQPANNGGPTLTMLPGPASPAIGRIPLETTLNGVAACGSGAKDQRGVSRPQNGSASLCTIGAVEIAAYAPMITSASSATFTVGLSASFQATATGSPTPTFTETGALLSGVSFSSSGLLRGTPSSAGSYTFTVTVSNGVSPDATQSFTLSVLIFTHRPGAATDVGVGADGVVWAIGTNAVPGGYGIYRWNGSSWVDQPGGATAIAVDPQGDPWVANSAHRIYHWTGLAWTLFPGAATDVGVGADGVVWAIGTNAVPGGYGIYRWNGSSWVDQPGGATTIAVDPQGDPWVANSAHRIYHWTGLAWTLFPGAATDVGVGADGGGVGDRDQRSPGRVRHIPVERQLVGRSARRGCSDKR